MNASSGVEEARPVAQRYDNFDELASSSDDDDSFPLKPHYQPPTDGAESQQQRRTTTTSRRSRERIRRRSLRGGAISGRPWLIFALGFISALVPCIILVSNPGHYLPDVCSPTSSPTPSSTPSTHQVQIQEQHSPSIKTVNTTFSAFPHKDMNLSATDAWNTLYAAPNQGMLYVQDKSGNPQSHAVLGVSMFHALHCLGMIRNLVTNSTAPMMSEPEHGAHGQPGVDDGVGDNSHISHCFFYIAQTLTCGADGTLEPPTPVLDPSGFFVIDHAVDGDSHLHVCKDPKVLWEVTLKSQEQPVKDWGWREGDSVQSVFGDYVGS